MALLCGAQPRLERKYCSGAANGTAGSGEQRGVAVQLEQLHAAPEPDQQGADHHQQRNRQARPADFGDFLQADPQAEKGHGDAQQPTRREVDAGRPARRHAIAQRVAVQGTGNDTDDQRADAQVGDGGQGCQLGDSKREKRHEQNAIEPPSGREGRRIGGVGWNRGHVSPPGKVFRQGLR
jgi:hypothetical protein